MDSFVSRENIRRHRKLASETTDATERSQIMKLAGRGRDQVQVGTEARRRPSRRKIAGQYGNRGSGRT